jgi:septum formation protein
MAAMPMPQARTGLALVLASESPRRLALLRQIGIEPAAVEGAHIDESPKPGERPADLAARLAGAKADELFARHPGVLVLGADTVVARDRRILPKPQDAETARRCLALLSGCWHRVHSAIAVLGPDGARHARQVETRVAFKRLSGGEIEEYLASGEWRGKAGGYAIQGLAGAFVRRIAGSYSGVVGLPLYETYTLLIGLGLAARWQPDPAP